jgi:soluble lytic murein transglycosylase-like protein
MRSVLIFLSLCAGAFAGEYAVLASGSRMRIDRHEVQGSKVRLYMSGGYADLNAAEVTRFEAEEDVAPTPANSAPAAAPAPQSAGRLLTPTPTPADMADRAADKYGLPRWLVRSVMSAESGYRPRAISPKGAIGLMQLMPATAQQLGADATDPVQNVDAGARYLRDLLTQYDGKLWHALAAYNAGPGAVEKYKGVPPYAETIRYINRIDRDRRKATEEPPLPGSQTAQRP